MLQVATDMLHLHSQRVDTYRGNYTEYYNTMTEREPAEGVGVANGLLVSYLGSLHAVND